ncbi:MAG: P-loop NTPase fold protein [Candidatus Sulfotelmatobacter sp.]
MSNHCETALLSDVPTTRDLFGPHERVASAIADLITSEAVGKSVAVTGPWGSGKSSVLRMVRERLAKTADVFIFDAWAHEGDPLRRTFLERLVDFLAKDNSPNKVFQQLKQDLSLRRKIQKITTRPQLTPETVIIVVALLLVPLGVAMFSAGLKSPGDHSLTYAGLVLCLLPIEIIVLLSSAAGLRGTFSAGVSRPFWAIGILVLISLGAFWQRHRLDSVLSKPSSQRTPISLLAVVLLVIVLLAIFRRTPFQWSDLIPLVLSKTIATNLSESIESLTCPPEISPDEM